MLVWHGIKNHDQQTTNRKLNNPWRREEIRFHLPPEVYNHTYILKRLLKNFIRSKDRFKENPHNVRILYIASIL